jgi:hypothetical protein
MPVDGIVLVLKKIRAVLCGETVGHDLIIVAAAATKATKANQPVF